MDNWRDKIDPIFREHLETLIGESVRHRDAYKLAKNTSAAQLWCAISILQKQLCDQNLKLKFMEKVLKDIGTKGKKTTKKTAAKTSKRGKKIDSAKELKKVLKRL